MKIVLTVAQNLSLFLVPTTASLQIISELFLRHRLFVLKLYCQMELMSLGNELELLCASN